jgi:hypothetical protein
MKVRRGGKSGTVGSRGRGLVPGQLVRGRVITRLGAGRFRIGAAGYIFNAQSDLPLETGQRLTARVEPGEAKIVLRILEDRNRKSPLVEPTETPAEIRRVLEGLGYFPDDLEINAFAERLKRCQEVVELPAGEPSSIWILAILWVRGIKGGADAYALTGFILRQASLQAFRDENPVRPDQVLKMLSRDFSSEEEVNPADSDPVMPRLNLCDRFIEDRRIEATRLLNRNAESCGHLTLVSGSGETACTLMLDQSSGRLARWADNPASPKQVLETAWVQGRIKFRLHFLEVADDTPQEKQTRWISDWNRELQQCEIETEFSQTNPHPDTETLRFLFWRKWERDAFFDKIV